MQDFKDPNLQHIIKVDLKELFTLLTALVLEQKF